jgi:hypothetical protein
VKRIPFDIEILGRPVSVLDWQRALGASRAELPELDDDQKKAARKFGETPEEYARRELAGQYGEERMRNRAGRLGEAVTEILEKQGRHYQLLAVIADMFKERWILTIKTPKGRANVAVPREVGDEVLDWGFREQREELRERVLYGIGLDKPLAKMQP